MRRYLTPLLLALATMPLQAQPLNDYQAVYRILPLRGDTPIGEYRIAQRWDEQHRQYVQLASIAFFWQVLLSTHHYRYQDEVRYGADHSLSYRLYEDNDGEIRRVEGEFPVQATALTLSIDDKQGQRQQTVEKTRFDYTLFALRLPVPCGPQLAGSQRRVRLLAPISGDISFTLSRYVGITTLHLPGLEPLKDLCLIETTGSSKAMNRQSWVNRDGYLVYEIAANYRLLLVPQASSLPSNHREKP
jgi:hypothetical protein